MPIPMSDCRGSRGPEGVNKKMGAFKYIQRSFEQNYATRSPEYRARIQTWRKRPTIERVEKPLNPVRAHALGYKAKKEFVVARVRMHKGKLRRGAADQGRKHGRGHKLQPPGRERAWYAEQKAKRRFPNLDVVGSYWVGEDGQYKYFEVLMHNSQDSAPRTLKA